MLDCLYDKSLPYVSDPVPAAIIFYRLTAVLARETVHEIMWCSEVGQ